MKRGALIGGIAAAAFAVCVAPAAATFPGQDGSIVYIDRGHVMTMNPDGSSQTQLTNGAGNSDPAFSESGNGIVYAHRTGKNQAIVVMDADGTHKHQLTKKHFDQTPAFSPNGRKIVFARGLHSKQYDFSGIFVMRSDGGHPHAITHKDRVDYLLPSYSPDGTKIVFAADTAGTVDIYVMNPDGTGMAKLTTDGHSGEPDW